jgi:hypothetical protein
MVFEDCIMAGLGGEANSEMLSILAEVMQFLENRILFHALVESSLNTSDYDLSFCTSLQHVLI